MDLDIYLQDSPVFDVKTPSTSLGAIIKKGVISFSNDFSIAIVGIEEGRNSNSNESCAGAPDAIREHLYKLFPGSWPNNSSIIDLGNIKQGSTVEDTYHALRDVQAFLLKQDVFTILIGGGHDLSYASYLAYEALERTINLTVIDNKFDLGDPKDQISSKSFLQKIILHQPNFLFNYANIGYQTYLESQESIHLMEKLNFDTFRLGALNKENLNLTEPIIRDSDFLSIDFSAVRASDAPGNANASSNGFYGEELCQMMRYAGLSNKMSCLGCFEVNPVWDERGLTSNLAAQMIWCFLDGYNNRYKEAPYSDTSAFYKYRVVMPDNHEILFYKSKKSEKWWIDVPYIAGRGYERHHFVPCSYQDYLKACNEQMPERYWRAYMKLC